MIILDATVGSQNGVDFYSRVRELPLHQHTPIILVTSSGDTKYPPGLLSSPETQFLAKPHNLLSYLELGLKSLSRVLSFRAHAAPGIQANHKPETAALPLSSPQQADSKTESPVVTPDPENAESQSPSESPTAQGADLLSASQLKKRNEDLEKELAGLWQMCDELNRQLAGAVTPAQPSIENPDNAKKQQRQSDPDPGEQSSELDRRLREGAAACARATADLEKERGERRRVEQRAASMAAQLQELHGQLKEHFESEGQNQKRSTEFEQQLREREEALARAQADLQKEKEERQLAEEQLRASTDLSATMRNCLSSFEAAKQALKRTQDELDSRLQASLKACAESEARLQKEIAERQRAEEALRSPREECQKSTLEISKLQSALEVEQAERKRLEGEAVQSRYASLDAARTLGNRLRRQIREPVENMMRTTRRLLESQLEEEPKKLVESVLENALLLQSSVQDLGNLNPDALGSNPPGEHAPKLAA